MNFLLDNQIAVDFLDKTYHDDFKWLSDKYDILNNLYDTSRRKKFETDKKYKLLSTENNSLKEQISILESRYKE